jgi:hypothetical protein
MLGGMGLAKRVLLVGMALLTGACSGSGSGSPHDAALEASAPPLMSCQQLRLCAIDCGDDACIQNCASHGTADAKAAFQALQACTAKTCALGDVTCACGEQCLADGNCLVEVDACLAGAPADMICDSLCH